MEIGAFGLLLVISLVILFVEGTPIGKKIGNLLIKNLVDIDVNELED